MAKARIDHIGIAVSDVENSIFFLREIFGAKLLRKNAVEGQKLISAVLQLGEINIELMQSTEKGSVIDKYITKKGEGFHHMSIQISNMDQVLDLLASNNIKIAKKLTYKGSDIAFINPKNAFGLLIELIERNQTEEEMIQN